MGSFAGGKDTMKLSDLVVALKQTYCGPIGAEYMHITSTEENAGFSSVSSLVVLRSVVKRRNASSAN